MKLKKAINIKKVLIGALVFMLSLHVKTHAISDEELYLQGNSFYLQGDYSKALSCYESMRRKGAAVFHNMGNCYSYLSNPVEALISWRQAQRGARHKEFDELERIITQETQNYYKQNRIEDSKINKNSFWAYARRLFSPYPLLWLQIIFLFFWCALFLFLYKLFYQNGSWRFWQSSTDRASSRVMAEQARRAASGRFTSLLYLCILGCTIFFEIGLGVGMWLKNKEQKYQQAVVIGDTVALRAGPQKKFKVVAEVAFLDEIVVLDSSKGWCKVVDKKSVIRGGIKKSGWLEEGSIKIINYIS